MTLHSGDQLVQVPALAISYSVASSIKAFLGEECLLILLLLCLHCNPYLISQSYFEAQGPVELQVVTSAQLTLDTTFNVFCTTHAGNPENVVMIGAHLGKRGKQKERKKEKSKLET